MPMIPVPEDDNFPNISAPYQPTLADSEFKGPPTPPASYGQEGSVLGGAAAGALAGTFFGGPIGTVIGGGLGAAAGGFAGAPPEAQQGALYNNDIARAFRLFSQPKFAPDANYDVTQDADIVGPGSKYQAYLDWFVGSQSRAQTQSIMSTIDRQNAADKAVRDAGTMGMLAQIASGAASPLTLLPVGGVIGLGTDVGRVGLGLRAAAEAAALGGVGGLAQGALAQATNPNATFKDTLYQSLINAAVGGLLGGGAGYFSGAERAAVTDALHSIPASVEESAGRIPPELASEIPPEVTARASQNPVEVAAFNSRLAANGIPEEARPDFVSQYANIVDQHNAAAAELESIRLEAGQPTTAPEYVNEAARITKQRDDAITQLETIAKDYQTEAVLNAAQATEAAKTAGEPAASVVSTIEHPPITEPAAVNGTGPRGVSKIGKSIETKAVDARLTNGFEGTAGYDRITIKDQAEQATNLVNGDLAEARAMVRGETPLPKGLHGVSLITAMEEKLAKAPNAEMAYELANSPLVSQTSSAAQAMRLAAERTPDSIAARFQAIRDARVAAIEKRGGAKALAKKTADQIAARIVAQASKQPAWTAFIKSIEC